MWRLDDPKIKELCTAWKVCCRKILGINNRARSRLIHQIMDTMPILYIIMYRILNFFLSGINHTNNFISNFFKNVLLSNSSYMEVNINEILREFDITYLKLF